MKRLHGALLTAVCVGLLLTPGMVWGQDVRTITVEAADAFERGMGAWHLRATADGSGVVLHDRTLIEDDGPGIGSDSKWLKVHLKSPVQMIEGDVRVKKVLHVDWPESTRAYLVLPRGVKVELNGSPIETNPKAQYPEIPVSLLKQGDNEVVLSCAEGEKPGIKTAPRAEILKNAPDRADRPGRSFLSDDGGQTWKPVDGEYLVRMHLIQHASEGHMISQAIDLTPEGPLATALTVGPVDATVDANTPKGTTVELAIRTGTSPLYEKEHWTDWQAPGAATPAGHRYVQWRAALRSSSGVETPTLKSVMIKAKVDAAARPAWAEDATVTAMHNGEIRYTSMPFAHEDFTHPKLVELRTKYKLDEVVAAGTTEYEKLLLLKDWVRKQWKYKPATEHYPAWDADEIMQLKRGFCVQFAIVYMQCSLSLGYTSRFVFGYHPGVVSTGHEVTEVWSNELDKWILMDANGNVHYVDPKTKVPLGMMEIHDRMLAMYYGDKPLERSNFKGQLTKVSGEIGTCWGTETSPGNIDTKSIARKRPPRWAKWGVIRMMPRNNFYSQLTPLPLTQGFTWDYSDYWIWEDARTPQHYAYRYRNITGRRSDWQWTPNRVRFDVTLDAASPMVTVRMSTVTPGLKTFVARTDGGPWLPADSVLTWRLHQGRNKLEMRTRNLLGVEGAVSSIELNLPR